jgi:hypothetical protein
LKGTKVFLSNHDLTVVEKEFKLEEARICLKLFFKILKIIQEGKCRQTKVQNALQCNT